MLLTDITESQVQKQLLLDKRDSSLVMVPNLCAPTWWENDMMQVTKAGYWVEYEIKRSLSDYNADFRKNSQAGTKHEILASGEAEFEYDPYEHLGDRRPDWAQPLHKCTPNRFYFCVPQELADKISVPDYAGLMVFSMCNRGSKTVYIKTEKQAPLRHRQKYLSDSQLVKSALSAAYYRYTDRIMYPPVV